MTRGWMDGWMDVPVRVPAVHVTDVAAVVPTPVRLWLLVVVVVLVVVLVVLVVLGGQPGGSTLCACCLPDSPRYLRRGRHSGFDRSVGSRRQALKHFCANTCT